MKKYSTQELILLILKYRKYENDIEGYSSKLTTLKSNKLTKKIANFKIQFSVKSPQKAYQYIAELIENTNILVSSFAAVWAMNCNVYVDRALDKIIKMSKSEEYKISSFNAAIFAEIILLGKYGGWKRDERYPDLSEYESKK